MSEATAVTQAAGLYQISGGVEALLSPVVGTNYYEIDNSEGDTYIVYGRIDKAVSFVGSGTSTLILTDGSVIYPENPANDDPGAVDVISGINLIMELAGESYLKSSIGWTMIASGATITLKESTEDKYANLNKVLYAPNKTSGESIDCESGITFINSSTYNNNSVVHGNVSIVANWTLGQGDPYYNTGNFVSYTLGITSGNSLTVNDDVTLTISEGDILNVQDDLIVNGTLKVEDGGTVNIYGDGELLVDGTLEVEDGGIVNIYGNGKLLVDNGTLEVESGGTVNITADTGSITVADTGTLDITQGATLSNTLTNASNIDFDFGATYNYNVLNPTVEMIVDLDRQYTGEELFKNQYYYLSKGEQTVFGLEQEFKYNYLITTSNTSEQFDTATYDSGSYTGNNSTLTDNVTNAGYYMVNLTRNTYGADLNTTGETYTIKKGFTVAPAAAPTGFTFGAITGSSCINEIKFADITKNATNASGENLFDDYDLGETTYAISSTPTLPQGVTATIDPATGEVTITFDNTFVGTTDTDIEFNVVVTSDNYEPITIPYTVTIPAVGSSTTPTTVVESLVISPNATTEYQTQQYGETFNATGLTVIEKCADGIEIEVDLEALVAAEQKKYEDAVEAGTGDDYEYGLDYYIDDKPLVGDDAYVFTKVDASGSFELQHSTDGEDFSNKTDLTGINVGVGDIEIEEVDLSDIAPIPTMGDTLSTTFTPSNNAGYTVDDLKWTYTEDNGTTIETVTDGDKVVDGAVYTASFTLTPETGYTFGDDLSSLADAELKALLEKLFPYDYETGEVTSITYEPVVDANGVETVEVVIVFGKVDGGEEIGAVDLSGLVEVPVTGGSVPTTATAPTGLTQNVKDFLCSPQVANIFENSDFVYLLNQAGGYTALSKNFQFDSSDYEVWVDFLINTKNMIINGDFKKGEIMFEPPYTETQIEELRKNCPEFSDILLAKIDGESFEIPDIDAW